MEILYQGIAVVLVAIVFVVAAAAACAIVAGLSTMTWELCTWIMPKLTLKKAIIAVAIPAGIILSLLALGYLAINIGLEQAAISVVIVFAISAGTIVAVKWPTFMKKNKRKRRKLSSDERAALKNARVRGEIERKEAWQYYKAIADLNNEVSAATLTDNKTS